jgi:4-diphosphocytidyl-2-C-methyl-D-erythritol kinase
MGAALGSDVPFFIHKIPAARVTGRGECIEPIDMLPMFLTLVNPGFHSDTARAFKLLDEYRESGIRKDISPFFNDFLPVFPEQEKSVYNTIISRLQDLGAEFASLSGAGSTCFGVFGNRDQSQKAADVLRGEWGFAECCLTTALVV